MIVWRIQDKKTQNQMVRLLTEQKEVLEESNQELADIRDVTVEGEE